MRAFIIVCLALGAQALKQERLSADPAFQLAEEDTREIGGEFDVGAEAGEEVGGVEEFGMRAEELMTRMAVYPDLMPSDFKEKSSREQWRETNHQAIYFGTVFGFGAFVAAIYSGRGIWQCAAICAYVISLTLMSLSIRNVFVNFSFNYPQFLVVMHSFATAIVGGVYLKYREATGGKKLEIPSVNTVVKGLGPVSMSFALSLGLSNLGLLYANTHFYEMMGTFQIFAVVGLSVMLGRPFNHRFMLPLVAATIGLAAVAFGEMRFNILGAVFVLGGVIVRAAKVQLQSMLMAPNQMTQHFDAVELTFWTAVLTTIIMAAWSVASEGRNPFFDLMEVGTFAAVMATCGAACILNFCSLFVMKEVGPVAQQLIGQMKGVLACVGGWAAFEETITVQQIIGYAVVIGGIVWYNHVDMQIKAEARADMAKMLQQQEA
jgi:drug/metabolite transporter (DMT)-like permease